MYTVVCFKYAEDASFSDCIRAVLPAVLGERGGKRKMLRSVLCSVLCIVLGCVCVVLCDARGSLAASTHLLHTFFAPSLHTFYTA